MSAITTLGGLKAACADALVRSDFDERIATAVPLAEAWLNRTLRLRAMEAQETLTLAAGASAVALPTDFLEPLGLGLELPEGRTMLPQGLSGATQAQAMRPCAWAIEGSQIVFPAPSDAAYTLSLRMLRRFALAGDDDSNALLAAWPDLYLLALLTAVTGVWLTDDPRLAAWKGARDELAAEVRRKEARARGRGELRTEEGMSGLGASLDCHQG